MDAHVLIVDDEEAIAYTLGEVLAQEGYRVQQAMSTTEALAKLERDRYDVALLDLRVGEESGLTVLARLKETSPDSVALILTGFGSLETAIQALRQGASDYLLKPCDVGELKAAIARGLEQQRRVQLGAQAAAADDALKQALARAEQAREDFLMLAGHELKTPLAAVIGGAQYVQRQLAHGAGGNATVKLELVVEQAQHVARLVECFADLIRLQHGTLTLDTRPLDLRALIEQAARVAAGHAPSHQFCTQLPPDQVLVQGDPVRLRAALDSLLSNAVKFSPDGGDVVVSLTVEGDEARIVVRDQGVGIAPEELPRIFEPFYQADADVITRRFGGLGIGLYLCRALVELHGGRVWAESSGPDQGATLTVALPLREGER